MTTAHPLAWPPGWPRTPAARHEDSKHRFKKQRWSSTASPFWTFAEARDALFDEIQRLGGQSPVVSSDFPVDRYGVPTEGKRRPEDQGVAAYFALKGKPMVMACDQHVRAEENMRSLALAIEAMRSLARHGGGLMMERAFEGFAALPAPGTVPWRSTLQVGAGATLADAETAFRRLARERHPDRGGSDAMMADLNAARAAAQREFGGGGSDGG